MALETELKTFEALKATLNIHEGKYALIKGEDLIGVYDSQADALNDGYKIAGLEPFLVKKIATVESIGYFTRNISVGCTVAA